MLTTHLVIFPASTKIDVSVEKVTYSSFTHLPLEVLHQVSKPFKRIWLRADPVEVDLFQTQTLALLSELVVDRFQDGGEGSHSDPSTN